MDFSIPGLDLDALLKGLGAINPLYAVIGVAVLWAVQRFRNGQGLDIGKGGLLDLLGRILGGPFAPKPKPVDDPKTPKDESKDADPLAQNPLLKALRDAVLARLSNRFAEVEDEREAVKKWSALLDALDKDDGVPKGS